jgi:flavin-dependent dehydrogenase
MYDAIIVGARCAGSPTAMLLAQKGYKVLLADKSTFPSDTMSTLLIYPNGMRRLAHWGLLDRLRGSNCPPIGSWQMTFGDIALTGFPWSPDGVAETLAPRRIVLDKILVDAAVSAGAELREAFVFEDVIRDGDAVTGIRARTKSGGRCEERARIVVGADGMRSPVASAVNAAKVVERPPLTCTYYAFYDDVGQTRLELHIGNGRLVLAFPTNDGQALVGVIWPHDRFHEFRANIEANHQRTVEEVVPELGARLRAGKRAERFVGTADVQNFFRRSHGLGWALVGDAGYHKDPITAQGISDSFCYAELLVEAIDDGLAGRRPIADALARYEDRRNESATPIFEWTCRTAEMRPVSQKTSILLMALRASQEDTNRFLGLTAGTVLAADFFQPENLARIVTGGSVG